MAAKEQKQEETPAARKLAELAAYQKYQKSQDAQKHERDLQWILTSYRAWSDTPRTPESINLKEISYVAAGHPPVISGCLGFLVELDSLPGNRNVAGELTKVGREDGYKVYQSLFETWMLITLPGYEQEFLDQAFRGLRSNKSHKLYKMTDKEIYEKKLHAGHGGLYDIKTWT